jgi:hypothetical protein
MERFGDAMTGGVGPIRSSWSTGMTKLIERRSVGRTVVSKGARCCSLVPNAVVFTSNLSVLPPNLELSLDNFRGVRKCRLIWRRDDFIGIAFEK